MTNQISTAEYHDRIASLSPALRERAAEAEKQRRLSQQTIDELVAAGLYRAYLPARFGGPELFMAEVLPLDYADCPRLSCHCLGIGDYADAHLAHGVVSAAGPG